VASVRACVGVAREARALLLLGVRRTQCSWGSRTPRSDSLGEGARLADACADGEHTKASEDRLAGDAPALAEELRALLRR